MVSSNSQLRCAPGWSADKPWLSAIVPDSHHWTGWNPFPQITNICQKPIFRFESYWISSSCGGDFLGKKLHRCILLTETRVRTTFRCSHSSSRWHWCLCHKFPRERLASCDWLVAENQLHKIGDFRSRTVSLQNWNIRRRNCCCVRFALKWLGAPIHQILWSHLYTMVARNPQMTLSVVPQFVS